MSSLHNTIAGLVLALGLSACGGGGGDAAVAGDPLEAVPAAAQQSDTGMADYLWQMAQAAQAGLREAIDLAAVVLSSSDTTEPLPVN
jgi:hypothetical protein